MRILLAYKAHADGANDPYTSLLPIGLCYLNALLAKEGHDSALANFSQAGWSEISRRVAEIRPDIFGISQFTHNRFESLKLARIAKRVNPACIVLLGGPHATHRWREMLAGHPEIDAVIIGEGEETFRELVALLSHGRGADLSGVAGLAMRKDAEAVVTARRLPIADLDLLPFPAASIDNSQGVDIRRQLEFIITSRGCPASCRFCSSPSFWQRQVRFRSPRSIVDEIEYIQERYGLLYFSFRDDTFTADKRRVIELCRLLIREKVYILWNCQSRVSSVDEEMLAWMKRAGCECVQFGVESGSERTLAALGKRITPEQIKAAARAVRRAGINLSVYLISGIPGETAEDLAATMRLIEEIRPHDGQVSPLAYYPGTSLFTDAVSAGSVAEDFFERSRAPAFPVSANDLKAESARPLLECLERVGHKSRFRRKDFDEQKKLLGYCHATNIMAGEWYEEQGRPDRAELEYREILDHEPNNPWGWLALGELLGEMGRLAEARQAVKALSKLVPAFEIHDR